ncbi:MAG: DUF421 domain-containing protein [Acidimicrobiales bacterium]
MDEVHLWSSWSNIGWVVVTSVAIYLWILLVLRLNGLRTLASFSGYDVVVTVAIGSITATTALSSSVSLVAGLAAVGVLVVCQRLLTEFRANQHVQRAVDNRPILLIACGTLLLDNMAQVGVTRDDMCQKMRLNGASRLDQVAIAVFETTGDVSMVLRSDLPIDPDLFEGVRDFDRYLVASSRGSDGAGDRP